MFSKAVSILALAGLSSAAVQTIQVGGPASNPFVYSPNNIVAAAGDVIQFVFSGAPGLHSVTQSNFANPCQPLANGFNSGFVTVASGFTGPFEEYNITITNATQPIWFYCQQTNPVSHCIAGMSGAINAPNTTNTLAAYQANAKALGSLPAQTPSNSAVGGVGVSATASPATGSNPAATNTAPASSASAAGSSASSASSSSSSSASAASASASKSSASTISSANGFMALFAAAVFGLTL